MQIWQLCCQDIIRRFGFTAVNNMNKSEIKRYMVIALLAVAVCFVVQNLSVITGAFAVALKALYPLGLGVVLAYIINIIMSWFEAHYFPKSQSPKIEASRRPVCLVLSLLSCVAILALILNIIIPEIINAVKIMSVKIPPLMNDVKIYFLKMLSEYPELQKQASSILNEFDFKELDWASITGKVSDFLQKGVMGFISSAVGVVSAITGTLTNYVLAFIFALYILLRKPKLLRDFNRIQNAYFSEKMNRKFNHVCKTAHECFRNFFVGQFVEAIILGSLCFIGMTILKLPYAAMSGTLVGVTALIPIVGAFIGAGVSAFIIMTDNPMQALIFIIFLIILQQLEGNIIYPKVVGDSIGLPGIWVLAAVTVGGGLWGIPGMLIGVPLAATAYKLSFDVLEAKEIKMGIEPPVDPEKKEKPKKPKKTKKDPAPKTKTTKQRTSKK